MKMSEPGKPLVLVIDDEPQIRRLLQTTLTAHDYDIIEAATGEEGLLLAASRSPEAIILDMNLPGIQGMEVLKRLREWFTRPVMILSVMNDEESIVEALDLGADDYLTKPFGVPELLARLRVCFRHNQPESAEPIFKSGPLTVDLSLRNVLIDNNQIHLTSTEYNLLKLFIHHAGKVLTHHFILKEVWGLGSIQDVQYLRVYMAHLRQKLEQDPNRPQLLITEPGIGYRLQLLEAKSE
jgi:two-component system, OmpR family, KDP operon response regulator KdpE